MAEEVKKRPASELSVPMGAPAATPYNPVEDHQHFRLRQLLFKRSKGTMKTPKLAGTMDGTNVTLMVARGPVEQKNDEQKSQKNIRLIFMLIPSVMNFTTTRAEYGKQKDTGIELAVFAREGGGEKGKSKHVMVEGRKKFIPYGSTFMGSIFKEPGTESTFKNVHPGDFIRAGLRAVIVPDGNEYYNILSPDSTRVRLFDAFFNEKFPIMPRQRIVDYMFTPSMFEHLDMTAGGTLYDIPEVSKLSHSTFVFQLREDYQELPPEERDEQFEIACADDPEGAFIANIRYPATDQDCFKNPLYMNLEVPVLFMYWNKEKEIEFSGLFVVSLYSGIIHQLGLGTNDFLKGRVEYSESDSVVTGSRFIRSYFPLICPYIVMHPNPKNTQNDLGARYAKQMYPDEDPASIFAIATAMDGIVAILPDFADFIRTHGIPLRHDVQILTAPYENVPERVSGAISTHGKNEPVYLITYSGVSHVNLPRSVWLLPPVPLDKVQLEILAEHVEQAKKSEETWDAFELECTKQYEDRTKSWIIVGTSNSTKSIQVLKEGAYIYAIAE